MNIATFVNRLGMSMSMSMSTKHTIKCIERQCGNYGQCKAKNGSFLKKNRKHWTRHWNGGGRLRWAENLLKCLTVHVYTNRIYWSLNRCNKSREIAVLFFHLARVICSQNKCTYKHTYNNMYGFSFSLAILFHIFNNNNNKNNEWRNVSGKIVPNMHIILHGLFFAMYTK